MKSNIRKLTPRERFRLMGVSDKDIDKLLASGISDNQLFKLSGNSIVVDVLTGIFKNMNMKKLDDKGKDVRNTTEYSDEFIDITILKPTVQQLSNNYTQGDNCALQYCPPPTNAVARPLYLGSCGEVGSDKDIKKSINDLKKLIKKWKINDSHTFALIISNTIGAQPHNQDKDVDSISYYLSTQNYTLRIGLHNLKAKNFKRNKTSRNYGAIMKSKKSKNTFEPYDNVHAEEYVYFTDNITLEKFKQIAISILNLLETGVWDESIAPADQVNISPEDNLSGTDSNNVVNPYKTMNLNQLIDLYFSEYHSSIDDIQEIYKFAPERKAKRFLLDFMKPECTKEEIKKLEKQSVGEIVSWLTVEFKNVDIQGFFEICSPTKLKDWFVHWYFPKIFINEKAKKLLEKYKYVLMSEDNLSGTDADKIVKCDFRKILEAISLIKKKYKTKEIINPIKIEDIYFCSLFFEKICQIAVELNVDSFKLLFRNDTAADIIVETENGAIYKIGGYRAEKPEDLIYYLDYTSYKSGSRGHYTKGGSMNKRGENIQFRFVDDIIDVNSPEQKQETGNYDLSILKLIKPNRYPDSSAVYFDNGYAYYCDSNFLVKEKTNYPNEFEKKYVTTFDYLSKMPDSPSERDRKEFLYKNKTYCILQNFNPEGLKMRYDSYEQMIKELSRPYNYIEPKDFNVKLRTAKALGKEIDFVRLKNNAYYDKEVLSNICSYIKKYKPKDYDFLFKIENDSERPFFYITSEKYDFFGLLSCKLPAIFSEDKLKADYLAQEMMNDYFNKNLSGVDEENIENGFYSGEYDSKHILNTSDKIVDAKVLREIENQGFTYEMLKTLNVPIYFYRTQITVHGKFPELENARVGAYKNLFLNKNKSLGIRYNAVDYLKKKRMYVALIYVLQQTTGYHWVYEKDSQKWDIYTYGKNADELYQTLKNRLERTKKTWAHITNPFSKTVSITLDMIAESEMDNTLQILTDTNYTIEQAEKEIKEKSEAYEREVKEQERKQAKERREQEDKAIAKFNEIKPEITKIIDNAVARFKYYDIFFTKGFYDFVKQECNRTQNIKCGIRDSEIKVFTNDLENGGGNFNLTQEDVKNIANLVGDNLDEYNYYSRCYEQLLLDSTIRRSVVLEFFISGVAFGKEYTKKLYFPVSLFNKEDYENRIDFSYSKLRERDKNALIAIIKNIKNFLDGKTSTNPTPIKTISTSLQLLSFGDYQIADYNEKTIAITGNTKPLVNELKAQGGWCWRKSDVWYFGFSKKNFSKSEVENVLKTAINNANINSYNIAEQTAKNLIIKYF